MAMVTAALWVAACGSGRRLPQKSPQCGTLHTTET